jgi:hypothetical protein
VLRELRRYGSMKGQGYLFGQPQPASETHEWLQSQGLLVSAPPKLESPKSDDDSRAAAPVRPLAGNG